MPVMSSTIEMLYKAQDHASRVIGNINTSLSSQLTTFLNLGMKVPLVSRNMSAAMVVATIATERYVRELRELQKYTGLQTKTLLASQHAIEQSGASYDSLARFVDKVRDAQEKGWKVENQVFATKLAMYNMLDKQKGIMTDTNEIMRRATEEIMKYKEGHDRLHFAQAVFGDEAMAGILEKQAEAYKLVADRGSDYVKLTDLATKQVKENQLALSELTMIFKDFGTRILTIVIPVLTVMIKMMSITMDIFITITKPIFAVLRAVSAFIAEIKEWIAVLGIVGKLLIWIGLFVLGFYIRNLILAAGAQLALKVSASALLGQIKGLGEAIKWTTKLITDIVLWKQSMIASIYTSIKANGGWIASLRLVGIQLWSLMLHTIKVTFYILVLVAVFLIAWEAANKLMKALLELRYAFAQLYSSESELKSLRQELNLINKDIDAWSVEGVFERLSQSLDKTTGKAKNVGKEFRDIHAITEDMYDTLGDTLERVVNMPANVVPALMERMKTQETFYKNVQDASKGYHKAYAQAQSSMPSSGLERSKEVRVKLEQKVTFGDFGEPMMKSLQGAGIM